VEWSVRLYGKDGVIARDRSQEPASVEAPTAEALAARALAWLLRGGTWEGLARELAWEAVRSTGVESSCLEWLPGLIEAHLSEYVDGLEFVLEPARASGRAAHLREWPHDHAGAEAAAIRAADERAAQEVSRIYLTTLQWAADLLHDRLTRAPRAARPRLRALRRERPPAELEVPTLVADGLTQDRLRHGWPDGLETVMRGVLKLPEKLSAG
jgi:hypothetical protein